jgi:ATP-dependent Clp protease ATP-binding subunit ClpC
MFERFTDRARRVVVTAQEEARMLGHNHIGSEHLLLGLLDVQGGVAVHVLESAGITAEAARVQVEEITGAENKSPRGHIPFTPRAKKILELSLREALEQRKSYIGTEHILLAVIRDSEGVGAQVLERLGGSLSALRQRVLETDRTLTPEAAAETESAPGSPSWNWQYAQGAGREARLQSESVIGFRRALASFDQRLANIERHLEITIEEPAAGGFGGLLASVGRRLTSIERHLGVTEAPGTDADGATDTDPGTGTDAPEADAE